MNSITPTQLQTLLTQQPCIILDVREPAEFADAHLDGAISIPLATLNAQFPHIQQLTNGKTTIVMCHAGGRSSKAHQLLLQKGLHTLNLNGGISAWTDAKLPTTRPQTHRLPIIRQLHITIGLILLAATTAGLAGISWCFWLPLALGAGLTFAGLTGICPLAMLLARMPWNHSSPRQNSCKTSCTHDA